MLDVMRRSTLRLVVLHNVIAPYKTFLFQAVSRIYANLTVVYLAETERIREWRVEKTSLGFAHRIISPGRLEDAPIRKLLRGTWIALELLRPDVLIIDGWNHPAYWMGLLWGRVRRKRLVLWSSSTEVDRARTALKEALKRVLVRQFDAATVYGGPARDYLVGLGVPAERIFEMGNSTDTDYYRREAEGWRSREPRLRERLGLSPRNFIFIGRLSPEKNLVALLAAYRRLLDLGVTGWGLVLVGDGPSRSDLEAEIGRLGLRDVYMPGFKQREEVPMYLAAADVFVLPSLSETWGLVVNEAMSAGLPVLVSRRCGCCSHLVREGINGFSFDPLDEDDVVHSMRRCVAAAEGTGEDLARMGAASSKLIDGFSPTRAAEEVARTVDSVLS